MDLSAGVADLHTHTIASDGTSTVPDRIEQARERDLSVLAVTDHGCIADTVEDRVTTRDGVTLVTGVEVRADLDGEKVELLGYFVDPGASTLRSVLSDARAHRTARNRQLATRLSEVTDESVDLDAVADRAAGIVGRPHFARYLVDAGVVDSFGEAFYEYLGRGGDAYVPMERVSHERVLEAIHDAGGVASMAHPGRMDDLDVPAAIERLATAGLDGLEVPYPYGQGPSLTVDEAATLADRHGLLWTGGSDCHGPTSGKFRLGETRLAQHRFRALCEAAGVGSGLRPT